ncbi:diacylglycerol/lipid kinase family protein [Mucilaginibacter antarcticus]|uniref:diacylglycerol/lipid kinase family protein n=1 Tax=Mucilaginibacter antarcticus TaxID=1855725 RepID=UPI0036258206
METNNIFIVVNLASGKDEPVLDIIKRVFNGSKQTPTIYVTKEHDDLAQIIRTALPNTDLIAVYGGDGSVTQSAAALIGTNKPLAIIPGGTANILSKELNIPQDIEEALILIRDGKFELKTIDTGVVNERPFYCG